MSDGWLVRDLGRSGTARRTAGNARAGEPIVAGSASPVARRSPGIRVEPVEDVVGVGEVAAPREHVLDRVS